MNIGFIGAGNMGGAILRGYIAKAREDGNSIYMCGRDKARNSIAAAGLGAVPCIEPRELVEKCDIFIIGVEPGTVEKILLEIKESYSPGKLCISMAAGITIRFIESILGKDAAVVRIMPNTPAKIGEGVTSLSGNKNVSKAHIDCVKDIFNTVGICDWVDEDMIHSVIGVSGSSPAYTYLYIGALIDAAVEEGMDEATARRFAAQSVLGAAKMILAGSDSCEKLCNDVCSPGGATIEAVNVLREEGFESIVKKAFKVATDKSRKMTGE